MNLFKVLIVDDNTHLCESLRDLLSKHGFTVVTASNPQLAEALIRNDPYDFAVAVVDLKLGTQENDGVQLVEEIKKINPEIGIAIYSGNVSVENVRQTFKAGAVDFIEKSVSHFDIVHSVKSIYNKFEETRSVSEFTPNTPDEKLIAHLGIKGRSRALSEGARKILKLKNSDTTVLIIGENGTGKELFAKAVYQNSPRNKKPFVAQSLAAINDGTEESELFGHVRGSFTGAVKDKKGLFELADGGTLFLDEIGEAKPSLQAKLLRVLQDGTFMPVGGETTKTVDVRVIAATNRNLQKMVKDGLFREDLFYRLNVLNLHIPPLRERPEDIEPLVAYFCARQSVQTKTKKRFLIRTIRQMERYGWPGNVRELENIVENLWILCDDSKIEPHHLDSKFFQKTDEESGSVKTWNEIETWLKNKKVDFLRNVLENSRSKSDAASKLGISPSTLHSLMKANGLYSNESEDLEVS